MTIRGAIFDLFTKEHSPEGFAAFGYVPEIVAVCTLNERIEVFTVRESGTFWGKHQFYVLSVHLHNVTTSREMGRKEFTTAEEAIEYGKEFVKSYFPEASTMIDPAPKFDGYVMNVDQPGSIT